MNLFPFPRPSSPSKSAGFSLIESLVAITVLLTAVVAPLVIVSGSVSTANVSKDQITAFYLANEAIEFVHNVRDTNFLSGRDWLIGLEDCISPNVCTLDSYSFSSGFGIPVQICSGVCPALVLNTHNSPRGTFYNYELIPGGRQTTFNRSVTITRLSNDEAKVEITVDWKTGSLLGTGSVPRQFKATTVMQRWL